MTAPTGSPRRVPAPRPALRKAHDAELHPAAGPSETALPDTASDDVPTEAAAPAPERAEPVPADGAALAAARTSGQTRSAAATAFWEALQTDAAAALDRTARTGGSGSSTSGKPAKRGKPGKVAKKKFQGATSDVLRTARADDGHDLLLGKQATLEVRIPKRLRKAATAQAERHGTTLDNVVTHLLAGWVDGS